MDSTRSFLQSSATSDSCVNVKKQRGRMPPAAKGLSPFGNPLGKTMTPVGARLRAPTGVIIFQVGPGAEPPAARGIFLPSLKDKVQLFLERIQIPRGPGAGFGVAGFEHVPDELGVFVQGLAPVANGFEEGVHGFDEELFAVVGDKRQLRKR